MYNNFPHTVYSLISHGYSFDIFSFLQKRHQRMLQQPRHLPQSLYMAGKGFVMGVAVGLSGVVMNPVRGE